MGEASAAEIVGMATRTGGGMAGGINPSAGLLRDGDSDGQDEVEPTRSAAADADRPPWPTQHPGRAHAERGKLGEQDPRTTGGLGITSSAKLDSRRVGAMWHIPVRPPLAPPINDRCNHAFA